MRYLYIFLALVFGLFAYWQFNDPDAERWALVYGGVAVLHLLAARGLRVKWGVLMAALGCLIWMLTMLPGVSAWYQAGMPSIASEMSTDQPHIEIVREFFGLLICVLALAHLAYRSFRTQDS